jgi:hypothetical protein
MTKLFIGLPAVLVVSLLSLGQAPASPANAEDRCVKAEQAVEAARTECANLTQQLLNLKTQMAAEEEAIALLKQKCRDGDVAACKELNEISSPRLQGLQQQYDQLAQKGCPNFVSIPRECLSAPKSGQQTIGATKAASTRELKASTPPAPQSDKHRQTMTRTDPSRAQPKAEGQSSSPSSTHSSGGDRGSAGTGMSGAGPMTTAGNSASSPHSTAPTTGANPK